MSDPKSPDPAQNPTAIAPGAATGTVKKKPAVLNIIWLYIILVSIVVAAYNGRMDAVGKASFDSAKSAVTLAISLFGSG